MEDKRAGTELSLQGFIETLDKSRPCFHALAEQLQMLIKNGPIVFYRKDGGLVEVIQALIKVNLFPVIDKKLRVIIGVSSSHHTIIGSLLYDYHTSKTYRLGMTPHRADGYIYEGHGYWISSMCPAATIVGRSYRPDRLDKDLFMFYPPA